MGLTSETLARAASGWAISG